MDTSKVIILHILRCFILSSAGNSKPFCPPVAYPQQPKETVLQEENEMVFTPHVDVRGALHITSGQHHEV